jgi:peptidoglycan hydrolase-like protein with peptidoglycan-binding domain
VTREASLAAGVVVVAAIGAVVALSSAHSAAPAAAADTPPANTATVTQGPLADMVSQGGTLTYRARADGSPYTVVNQARGTYTRLAAVGDKIACGDVLYRVDDHPVLLLCGATPAYRSLSEGDRGRDVAQLNTNLVRLGYATRARLHPSSHDFSPATASALAKLQSRLGDEPTGSLALGQAVILPHAVRVAKVTGNLGGSARPGAPVLDATSDTPEVQVALDPSLQGAVHKGDPARITLPSNTSVAGRVTRLGRVAQTPAGHDGDAGTATIPVSISLDHPKQARGLDTAPVQVEITTKGVASALSVPVTAIVGKSGGGFAVETVGGGGRRALVAVRLGLFDTAGGRVQVEGALRAGDHVVVPSL